MTCSSSAAAEAVAGVPGLPPLSRAAFLLDLDGTLLDIAPTPGSVVVPPGLVEDLAALRTQCGGALAIVTGRPVAEVDVLLGDAPTAVAGEHGTAIRHRPGAATVVTSPEAPPLAWREAAGALAAAHPGTMLEHKAHGFVLHYRASPAAGDALHRGLVRLLAASAGFVLLAAKMAWEVRPAGTDKGTAVRALMREAPFRGRVPVFVGDDVTDEDGIAAARALGGVGLRVPENFADARAVRDWVGGLAHGHPAAATLTGQ